MHPAVSARERTALSSHVGIGDSKEAAEGGARAILPNKLAPRASRRYLVLGTSRPGVSRGLGAGEAEHVPVPPCATER